MANTVLCDIFWWTKFKLQKGLHLTQMRIPKSSSRPIKWKNLEDLKNLLVDDCNLGFAYDGDVDRIAVLTQKI